MDAPKTHAQRLPAFRRFMADLGIHEDADFLARFQSLLSFLPEIEARCEQILQSRS